MYSSPVGRKKNHWETQEAIAYYFARTIWPPFGWQALRTNQKGGWPMESEGSIGPSSIPHSNRSWFSLLLLFWLLLLLLLLCFSFRIMFCFRILVFVLNHTLWCSRVTVVLHSGFTSRKFSDMGCQGRTWVCYFQGNCPTMYYGPGPQNSLVCPTIYSTSSCGLTH